MKGEIVWPETPKEIYVRNRTVAGIVAVSLLGLAGCLLSTGCSAAQMATFKMAMDPVAAEVQRKAVEDAAAGEEWDSGDLLTALGGAGLALLGIGGYKKYLK